MGGECPESRDMRMRDLVERSGDVFFVRDVLLFWDVTKCVINKSRKSDTYLVYWAKSFPTPESLKKHLLSFLSILKSALALGRTI